MKEGNERDVHDGRHIKRAGGERPQRISRRTFLAATGFSVVLVASGDVGVITSNASLLRPPGGQDERSFFAGCNHCGRCVSVCHTRAIGVATLSDGLAEARTPVMKFNLGFCDFCGDCAAVCPTGALCPFDVAAAQTGDVSAGCIGKARLNQQTCLAWTSNSCNLCFEECPYEAISLDDGGMPAVDKERCNGCGVCEYVCPVLSLRSYIGGTARAITVQPVHLVGTEVPQ